MYSFSKKFAAMRLTLTSFFVLLLALIRSDSAGGELFTAGMIGAGVGAIYGGYNYFKCKFGECCGDEFISTNVYRTLQEDLENHLYGQHLAVDVVLKSISAHAAKQHPNKALVLSFHGWTGSGKNHLAKMIANALYKKGMASKFVHLTVSTLHFPHPEEIKTYKEQLCSWVRGNLTVCGRSLFIFDEMDKMPFQLMDVILPFIDFYDSIAGVDPRRSVFLFLSQFSNTGGTAIADRTLSYYSQGRGREEIPYKEMEAIIKESAYNEGEGGLRMSRLISKHLIDYFIPFLPLERRHVVKCFKDYMRRKGINIQKNNKLLDELADSLHYFPKVNSLFSVSGCKHVEQKVDYMYWELLNEPQDSHEEL